MALACNPLRCVGALLPCCLGSSWASTSKTPDSTHFLLGACPTAALPWRSSRAVAQGLCVETWDFCFRHGPNPNRHGSASKCDPGTTPPRLELDKALAHPQAWKQEQRDQRRACCLCGRVLFSSSSIMICFSSFTSNLLISSTSASRVHGARPRSSRPRRHVHAAAAMGLIVAKKTPATLACKLGSGVMLCRAYSWRCPTSTRRTEPHAQPPGSFCHP